jgi:hypothetical protein
MAARSIREAGDEYAPPALTQAGDVTGITFYAMNFERGLAFEVQAELSDNGTLRVETRELVPNP